MGLLPDDRLHWRQDPPEEQRRLLNRTRGFWKIMDRAGPDRAEAQTMTMPERAPYAKRLQKVLKTRSRVARKTPEPFATL